jgi:hypothetical protein
LTLRAGLQRFHSRRIVSFGVYLLLLALNYVPLLLHAIGMARAGRARQEIAGELEDKRTAFRKYRRQSLWLLAPLIVPVVAILQEVERRPATRASARSSA